MPPDDISAHEPAGFSLEDAQVRAALQAADDPGATPAERAEMLMEIATGLQTRPRSPAQLSDALDLYRRAQALLGPGHELLAARIRAREGTAHQALPDGGAAALHAARACFEQARPVLASQGLPEEVAELDLNLGLVTQALAQERQARVPDAIAHYHHALKVFTRERWPREFAIVHNNLAVAYLSLPAVDERSRMAEALAVQSYEEVLKVVTLVDHPAEYAMTQNNLGNALQYAPSGHRVANLLRALQAYDEALKVRDPRTMPVPYANTIANQANALLNLPDSPEHPEQGNAGNRARARALYGQARQIFERHGLAGAAVSVAQALADLDAEGAEVADFGASRVPGAPA
jgi:tetratricopeptide (TPR) repeat protein